MTPFTSLFRGLATLVGAASLAAALASFVALSACKEESAASSANTSATATKPADGAPGVCCVPSTGGCADIGGYRADGDCSHGGLCDDMCEQQIVDDEHGCKKMIYKAPPVETTYASTASCSDPVFNGVDPYDQRDADAPADASSDGDAFDGG